MKRFILHFIWLFTSAIALISLIPISILGIQLVEHLCFGEYPVKNIIITLLISTCVFALSGSAASVMYCMCQDYKHKQSENNKEEK